MSAELPPAPPAAATRARPAKRPPASPWDAHMTALRRLVNKAQLPQGLIEAYLSTGWRDSATDKLIPQAELRAARRTVRRIKASVRAKLLELRACEDALPQLPELGDEAEGEDVDDVFCCRCGSFECDDDNDILMCDLEGCRRAFHQRCLDPVLATEDIPEGDNDWFCHRCMTCLDALEMVNSEFDEDFDGIEEVFAAEAAAEEAGEEIADDLRPRAQEGPRVGPSAVAAAAAEEEEDEEDSSFHESDFSGRGSGSGSSGSDSGSEDDDDEEDDEDDDDDDVSIASGDVAVCELADVLGVPQGGEADVGRPVLVDGVSGTVEAFEEGEGEEGWLARLSDGNTLPLSRHALARALEAAERVASREARRAADAVPTAPAEESKLSPDASDEDASDGSGDGSGGSGDEGVASGEETGPTAASSRSRRARPRVDYERLNRLMFGDDGGAANEIEAMDAEYRPGQTITHEDMELAAALQASLESAASSASSSSAAASSSSSSSSAAAPS